MLSDTSVGIYYSKVKYKLKLHIPRCLVMLNEVAKDMNLVTFGKLFERHNEALGKFIDVIAVLNSVKIRNFIIIKLTTIIGLSLISKEFLITYFHIWGSININTVEALVILYLIMLPFFYLKGFAFLKNYVKYLVYMVIAILIIVVIYNFYNIEKFRYAPS